MNMMLDDSFEEIPSINKDEYIKSLEISIQMLQRELELLRKKLDSDVLVPSDAGVVGVLDDIYFSILSSKNTSDLFENFNSFIEKSKLLLEWVFLVFNENDFTFLDYNFKNENLESELKEIEEDGILDWVFSSADVKVAASLYDSTDGRTINNVFVFSEYGTEKLLLFAKSDLDATLISEQIKLNLKLLVNLFALKYELLTNSQKLNSLEETKSSSDSSVVENDNELLAIGLSEFLQSSLLIESNLDLIDKGVGNSKRRLEIIRENIAFVKDLSRNLEELLAKKEKSNNQLNDLINAIWFITSKHLQRAGIEFTLNLSKNYVLKSTPKIIECLLTDLILLSADLMQDSGNLVLSSQVKKSSVILKFSYDSAILTNSEFDKILSSIIPDDMAETTFERICKIIELVKSNNFELELINNKKIGTTFALKIE